MICEVVGTRNIKYGKIAYLLQRHESEEQTHEGLMVFIAFAKADINVGDTVYSKYYDKTGKTYAFKKK